MILSGQNRGVILEVGLALASLALLMRLLVPSGFMISPETAFLNGWSITICTGYGPIQASVDANEEQLTLLSENASEHAPAEPNEETACVFVALAGLWVIAFVKFYMVALLQQDKSTDITAQITGYSLASPPPAPRGPPILI